MSLLFFYLARAVVLGEMFGGRWMRMVNGDADVLVSWEWRG